MILDLLLSLAHGLATSVFSWSRNALPSPPSWVADLTSGLDTALGMIPEAVRYFVPLGPTAAVGVTLAGLVVAAGLVRLGRRVLSLLTGGGGNA